MNKTLQHYAASLLCAVGLSLPYTAAQASDITVFADIGAYSQYLARSIPQGTGSELSVQGDVGIDLGDGITVSAWFATGVGSDTEYDFTLDYSAESGDIAYSIGFYTIGYVDTPADDGGEFYLALSYADVSTAIYVAETYTYYELGIAYAVADMVDTSITLGYDDSLSKSDITLALTKDFEMDNYTLSPSFAVGKLQGVDAEFVVGINASF